MTGGEWGGFIFTITTTTTSGSMWTVGLRLVSTEQWRGLSALLGEQEEEVMEMLEPALLPLKELIVVEQCLTAGAQARGTLVRLIISDLSR